MRKVGSVAMIAGLALAAACGGPSEGDVEVAIERGWADDPVMMLGVVEDAPGVTTGIANAATLAAATARTLGGDRVGEVANAALVGGIGLAADLGLAPAQGVDERLSLKMARDWRVSGLTVLERREGADAQTVMTVRYDLNAELRRGPTQVVRGGRQTLRLGRDGGRWTVQSATPLEPLRR